MKTILIVDDDKAACAGLADAIESWGFEPDVVHAMDAALQKIATSVPDLAIVDLQLGDDSGLDLLERAKKLCPDLPVVILTGHATVDAAVMALKRGAEDFATKPVDLARLRVILHTVAEKLALRQEVLELRRQLQKMGAMGQLVGKSPAMQRLYEEVELVARTDASVFIIGESGTGKEVVASTIHTLSRRRGRPFIAFNCGAISATLIESEIFGHEKGAFTNAIRRREGYFELARGGTVFLDEITEMPLELQVKLLRVLEEGKFRRVGGNEEITIEARIVAATNRDPKKAIADGRLREDLYYRLNVFPLQIPPLRDRTEDVPLFAYHFLEELNETEDHKIQAIEPAVFEALKSYAWPGNVRELRNVMHRAFIVTRGDVITVDSLPAEMRAVKPVIAGKGKAKTGGKKRAPK